MPRPYSSDLRNRVLSACQAGEGPASVARRFCVARATVYLWLRHREEGTAAAKARGGRKPLIRGELERDLASLLASERRMTLTECRDRLARKTGVHVSIATVSRALRRLRLTRQIG